MTTLERYLELKKTAEENLDMKRLREIGNRLFKCWQSDKILYTIGNGGSASTASHLVADFSKGLLLESGKPLRCHCLNDNLAALTAWSNDIDYVTALGNEVRNFIRPGDYLLAISGSGNSPNILSAVNAANDAGAFTIGLCGFDGGKLAQAAATHLRIQSDNMQIVEDLHLMVGHMWYTYLNGLSLEMNRNKDSGIEVPNRKKPVGLDSHLPTIDQSMSYPNGTIAHISRTGSKTGSSMGTYLLSKLPEVYK